MCKEKDSTKYQLNRVFSFLPESKTVFDKRVFYLSFENT